MGRPPMPMPARRPAIRLAAILALLVPALAAPSTADAHPLGNFTVNHHLGVEVAPGEIRIDLVIDFAEIPTFQERRAIDADEDGQVADVELDAARAGRCADVVAGIGVAVDGRAVPLRVVGAGLGFPPGTAGLTMRLVCDVRGSLDAPITAAATVSVRDDTFPERIGWREIVAWGDGTTVTSAEALDSSPSARLTAYPEDLLTVPPDIRIASLEVRPGGADAAPWRVPEALPIGGAAASPDPVATPGAGATPDAGSFAPGGPGSQPSAAPLGSAVGVGMDVPGGIGDEVAALLAVEDLSPLAILGTLLLAAALGAGHALSPGHGKTVMAAYLVGSRGTARHALALGGLVTVSHTLGVAILALVVLSATTVVAPERLVPALATVSGVLFVGIGGWMLRDAVRARRMAGRGEDGVDRHGHAHEGTHEHPHEHEHQHDGHAHDGHAHDGHAHDGHAHDGHAHDGHAHDGHAHDHEHPDDGLHRHGGRAHRHLPVDPGELRWRSLVVLGLAGGLVPSVSALVLLLGAMAAGRPAYGLVLVVAFGVGMAAVLAGIGLLLVRARGLIERRAGSVRGVALARELPLVAAIVVLAAGLWVTASSLAGVAF